jgi:hypothetical protein
MTCQAKRLRTDSKLNHMVELRRAERRPDKNLRHIPFECFGPHCSRRRM